jgi:CHRD domain
MLVALAIAGVAAGCGGKSSSDTTPTTPGTPYPFAAKLDAAQVVPKPKDAENASGSVAGTITAGPGGGTLNWRLKLKGLTGPATAAQIHLGRARKGGVVALTLCAPCARDAHGSLGGNAGLLLALVDRPTYVEVQTTRNPKGEIRGRVVVSKPVGASGSG